MLVRFLASLAVACLMAWSSEAFAGAVYADPDVYGIVADHQVIAILPCDATVLDTRSGKKRMTAEERAEAAAEYSTMFQDSMYGWFLQMKRRGKLAQDVQDVEETRAILTRNGIGSQEDLSRLTKQEVATMLGVDAVFSSTATTTTTFNKGTAVALGILLGAAVSTGEADVVVKLFNAADGKMIWSFDRKVRGTYTSDPDDLVDYLMKRVSKRFPYKQ